MKGVRYCSSTYGKVGCLCGATSGDGIPAGMVLASLSRVYPGYRFLNSSHDRKLMTREEQQDLALRTGHACLVFFARETGIYWGRTENKRTGATHEFRRSWRKRMASGEMTITQAIRLGKRMAADNTRWFCKQRPNPNLP